MNPREPAGLPLDAARGAPLALDETYVIPYDSGMTTKTATQARADLYRLLDQVARTHEPVAITGRRHNGVLISEEDWRAIQETLYLLSVPGMRESIRTGLRTPLSKTSEKPGW
jgi:prevent-host-death family protein